MRRTPDGYLLKSKFLLSCSSNSSFNYFHIRELKTLADVFSVLSLLRVIMLKYEEYNHPIQDQQAWDEYVALVEELRKTAPAKKKPKDGYERHHIIARTFIPKDLWSDPDNIIIVPAKYHFRLHVLYARAVRGPMVYALHRMATCKKYDNHLLTEDEYAELKLALAKEVSKQVSGKNHPMYGKHQTEAARKKQSEIAKGRVWIHKGNKGTSVKPENLNEFLSNGWEIGMTEEARDNKKGEKNPFYGKKQKPEVIERCRQALTGRIMPPEFHAKMSEVVKGEKNPFYGKHHTEETKEFLSDYFSEKYSGEGNPFYGKTHSKEVKQKLSNLHKDSIYLKKEGDSKGIRVQENELNSYLELGYQIVGYSCEKGKWMTNGKEDKIVRGQSKIDSFLQEGWTFGRTNGPHSRKNSR